MKCFISWRKLLAMVLTIASIFPADQLLAASSTSFQVTSSALVASDTTTNATSTSFGIQSRSKFAQVHGTSSNFQMYSSFSSDIITDFILSTTTPVNGDIATNGAATLNDATSQLSYRDTKANFLLEVAEFGDHISLINNLGDSDDIAVVKRNVNFAQAALQEPIIFLAKDRVSNESSKILVAIDGALTMSAVPSFMGPVVEIALPDIEDFDEKYAIDVPTNTSVTFDGLIDVCMYGTPGSTGIPSASEVDIYYSDDGSTWQEDTSAVSKTYNATTSQFCFQTDHLTSFVIGQITESTPEVIEIPSGPGRSGRGAGGGSLVYNPQAIVAGLISTDSDYRIARTGGDNIAQGGLNDFWLFDPGSEYDVAFGEDTPASDGVGVSFPYEETISDAPKSIGEQIQEIFRDISDVIPGLAQTQDDEVAVTTEPVEFFDEADSDPFLETMNDLWADSELEEVPTGEIFGDQEFRASAPECDCEEEEDEEDDWFWFDILMLFWLFLLGILVGISLEYLHKRFFHKKTFKERVWAWLLVRAKKIRQFFSQIWKT